MLQRALIWISINTLWSKIFNLHFPSITTVVSAYLWDTASQKDICIHSAIAEWPNNIWSWKYNLEKLFLISVIGQRAESLKAWRHLFVNVIVIIIALIIIIVIIIVIIVAIIIIIISIVSIVIFMTRPATEHFTGSWRWKYDRQWV